MFVGKGSRKTFRENTTLSITICSSRQENITFSYSTHKWNSNLPTKVQLWWESISYCACSMYRCPFAKICRTYQDKKNQTDLRLLHTNHEYASHSAQPGQPSKVSLVDCTTFRHAHEQNILQHLGNTSYFLLVSYQRLTNEGLFNENPAIRPSRRHGQFHMPWSVNESVDSVVHYFKTLSISPMVVLARQGSIFT